MSQELTIGDPYFYVIQPYFLPFNNRPPANRERITESIPSPTMNPDEQIQMELMRPTRKNSTAIINEIAGPFEYPLRFSGLDLRRIATSTSKIIKSIQVLLAVGICIIFFWGIITVGVEEAKPFTVTWADINLTTMLCAYAFACAICLIFWTKDGFLAAYQCELEKTKGLRQQENEQIDKYRKLRITCMVFSTLLVTCWGLCSQKGLLYEPTQTPYNETEHIKSFRISKQNMFGIQPVVYIWMGLVAALATSIYWLAHEHLRREFEYFNEELKKASDAHEFTNADIFIEFGTRHRALIGLLHLLNSHLGKLAMINSFTAGSSMCFSLYITMGFMKHLTVPYAILLVMLNIVTAHILTIIISEPAKIQKQVYHTKRILLEDVDLPEASEQKILSAYKLFIDRSDNCSQVHLLGAVAVGRKTGHWFMFLVPNLATLLTFGGKLAGVIEV